jgi:hypothetical protein
LGECERIVGELCGDDVVELFYWAEILCSVVSVEEYRRVCFVDCGIVDCWSYDRCSKLLVENGLSNNIVDCVFSLFGTKRFAFERDTNLKKMYKK